MACSSPGRTGRRLCAWSALAASLVFFAYIGFDAVSTAAEECRNPQRDLPIGIIASLAVCTVFYMLVSAVLTGIVPYTELNTASPVATALLKIGRDSIAGWISLGAIAGLTIPPSGLARAHEVLR